MQYLKQNTSVTIMLGPFLDETDGKTAETGLSITQIDVRLSKNGGSFAQKSDISSLTHNENGWYSCSLKTTDTDTLGRLIVAVHKSGALPVWREFMVVPANVYDSLVGASDKLQVDVDELNGSATSLGNLQSMVNNAKGSDNKVLISTDDQDLSTTLHVDAKAISGSTTAADSLQSMADTALGTDDKILISTDTQDLSASLHVDAKAISGSTTAANNVEANITNLDATVSTRSTFDPATDTVDVGKWDGTVVSTGAASNLPKVDAQAISDSTTAADNVEANIPYLDKAVSAVEGVSVDDIMAGVVEGSYTLQSTLRLMFAVLCGKSSGGGTATLKFKDSTGTKDRVTATVDTNGNRLSMTLDAS